LARHYGASFSGHAGLTDAKLPSAESGAQKALSAVATLLAGGGVWIDAGLLSIDELFSPVQMVLDNELLSVLRHLARSFEVTEEAVGLETILEAGPGGHFLDKLHTARHFRAEQWLPEIWSRRMLRPWLEDGGRSDMDRARELALQVQSDIQQRGSASHMPEALEQDVSQIIERARQALVR
jgi:trimethylamine--corrinoid protein Co-methyltransferase